MPNPLLLYRGIPRINPRDETSDPVLMPLLRRRVKTSERSADLMKNSNQASLQSKYEQLQEAHIIRARLHTSILKLDIRCHPRTYQ